MNTVLAICKHTYDNGGACNSAAARGRDYCVYHLRYRARLLRMAQARARNERFDLKLPPLEDMFAVQSALNQLVEAVAADLLDLKRAQFLLAALRVASKNLLARDKWPAGIAHSDHPAPDVDLAAEYGLPQDLDVNTPPEVAFPESVILSEERSDESKSRRFAGVGVGSRDPERAQRVEGDPSVSAHRAGAGESSDLSPMPTVAYCKHGPGCPEHTICADFPVTPQAVEIYEVSQTQGSDAAAHRGNQLERNRRRRYINADRKRYAAIALEKNMRLAAERLAEEKLAADKAAAQAQTDQSIPKKPAASAAANDAFAAKEDAIA